MPTEIIVLVGPKGSGKSTAAGAIAEAYRDEGRSVRIMSFATPLKEAAAALTGWPIEVFSAADGKDKAYADGLPTPRDVILSIGEAMVASLGREWLGQRMANSLAAEKADVVVIDDGRLQADLDALPSGCHFFTVVREGLSSSSTHYTETEFDKLVYPGAHMVVHNDCSSGDEWFKVVKQFFA